MATTTTIRKNTKARVSKQAVKEDSVWTMEKKAELRKKMPKKLNKFGEWFFSENSLKEYLIVNDWKAVMK